MHQPSNRVSTEPAAADVIVEHYLGVEQVQGKSHIADNVEAEDDGIYFVDEKGNYYYHATPYVQPALEKLPDQEDTIKTNEDNLNIPENQVVVSNNDIGEGYLLVLKEPDDLDNTSLIQEQFQDPEINNNETIFEFSYNTEAEAAVSTDSEDDKSKITMQKHSFKCNYCTYVSPRKYLLTRHMRTHSEERPHKCNICERGFKCIGALQNHINTHMGVRPYLCLYCQKTFTTSGELIRHIKYMHTHEKPHKCPDCDYAAVELSKLKRHMRCHTGERPYQCPHCTYAACDNFKLKRHLRTHSGERPYTCKICSMSFTQSNSLKCHYLIHNVESKPTFQCELCPTVCGRKTDLRAHTQTMHFSDTPYKCKSCNKTFRDKYSIRLHKKTHQGEKCFKCDICPYASVSQRHLLSHNLIHTDEKPFACPECDNSFRQKQLLKRHLNIYHNANYKPPVRKEKMYVCAECKKEYANKGNLMRHLSTHDPNYCQQKELELKLGRAKKKVKYSQSQAIIEIESDDEKTLMTKVQEDQEYVVLEVLDVYGEGGAEQQLEIVAPESNGNSNEYSIHVLKNVSRKIDCKDDIDTCFGFEKDD